MASAFACLAATPGFGRRRLSGRVAVVRACAHSPSSPPVENVVIIGSGPAGYTAAIYAARANLRPIVLEGLRSGPAGGQLMTTSEVENYPGFVEGITGPKLMKQFRGQAARWGAQILTDDALAVEFLKEDEGATPIFRVDTQAHGKITAHSLIISTGASAKRLGLPSEDLFWSRGVSACSTCDGPLFKNKKVAVIGGGDSAAEEATFLTKYASHVYLLVRDGRMIASKAMQDRAHNHPNITVMLNHDAIDVFGSTKNDTSGSPLRGVRVKNKETDEVINLEVRGLFYAIGHDPCTKMFEPTPVALDENGYIVVKPGTPETSVAGVFAAGDVQDTKWRQAVTAAGTGCMAALAAERYLADNNLAVEYHENINNYEVVNPDLERKDGGEDEEDDQIPENKDTFDIEKTRHVGEFALRRLYHESTRPIMVKFVSPGCGPCKQLRPILSKVLTEYDNKIHFVEVNIEEGDVAESAGVTGTPTVMLFYEKAKMRELRGVKMRSDYRRALEECLTAST